VDPALAALLTDTVTQAAWTGAQDVYGAPTYAAPVTLPARVQWVTRRITTATGEERTARAQIFFDSTATIGLRDRLTLPDGTTPPLQAVGAVYDELGGLSHWEIYC
jgi:hypothetical protein